MEKFRPPKRALPAAHRDFPFRAFARRNKEEF